MLAKMGFMLQRRQTYDNDGDDDDGMFGYSTVSVD